MGAGLAKAVRLQFPESCQPYFDACKAKLLVPGKIIGVELKFREKPPFYIFHFPTKVHWKNPSTYTYVELGLKELARLLTTENYNKVNTIAIPALGCQLGGLNWPKVKDLIFNHLEFLSDKTFYLYPPFLKQL